MDAPRYRFAPSPTGFFHVGGARTALYNWALAKWSGGTFVLRIEDTDEARNRPEWTDGIIDALAWIGVGSTDPTFEGPYFQSSYVDQHVAAAQRLFAAGHAYYCDLTTEQIQERSKASGKPGYDGYSRDRGLGPGPGHVLRFRVPTGSTVVHDLIRGEVVFDNSTIEDFVLLRSNGTPVFLVANVVDDIEMRISHVIRAEEHLPNTPKQQMLWEALGHAAPVWGHVPLLVNEQRKKLSKRRDKVALEMYRDEGYLADAMVNYLMTLGWAPKGDTEIVPWSEIEKEFRLEDVTHSPAFFDLKKLAAFNGEYIRAMSITDFIAACAPWLERWRAGHPDAAWDQAMFEAMAPHVQTRIVTLAEAPGMVDFLFLPLPEMDPVAVGKVLGTPVAESLLAATIDAFEALAEAGKWSAEDLKQASTEVAELHEMKAGKAGGPARVAITGRTIGPPLMESLEVLGSERAMARLRAGLELARGERTELTVSDRPEDDRWTGEIHTAETLAVDVDSTRPTSAITHELPTGETAVTDSPAGYEAPPGADPTVVMATVATGNTGEILVADPTPVGGITRVRRRVRWRRRLVVGVLVVLLLGMGYYGVTLYQVHSTGQSDQAQPVDALVVMGAAHTPSDPSPQLAARLDHALVLWRAGLADTFVVTGGKIPGDLDTEAEASRDYLVEHGVDVADIQLENESRNTYDAFAGVVDLLGDDASVLIVTDPYHSLRSRLTAEELGLEAYVSPTRTSPVQGTSARTREMKEAVGVALGRIIGFDRLLTLTG